MTRRAELVEERAYGSLVRDVGAPAVPASFARRVLALVIDFAVVGAFCGALMGALVAVELNGPALPRWLIPVIFVPPMWLGFGLYFVLLESSPRQGTLGMIALGLRVVGPDGGRIGWVRSAIRLFLWLTTTYIFPVAVLVMALHPRGSGLHDVLTGCMVVAAEPGPAALLSAPAPRPAAAPAPPGEGIAVRDAVLERG